MSLVEIIFNGKKSDVKWDFLHDLILKSSNVRFNFPDRNNYEYFFIREVFEVNEYVDLAFDSYRLNSIPNVFVNLTLDNDQIELLFFLDLKDIDFPSNRQSMDELLAWAEGFSEKNNFSKVICQPDNAEKGQFYFSHER